MALPKLQLDPMLLKMKALDRNSGYKGARQVRSAQTPPAPHLMFATIPPECLWAVGQYTTPRSHCARGMGKLGCSQLKVV